MFGNVCRIDVCGNGGQGHADAKDAADAKQQPEVSGEGDCSHCAASQQQAEQNLADGVVPVGESAEEWFCGGNDDYLYKKDDAGLPRGDAGGKEIERKEGFKGAETEVGCHFCTGCGAKTAAAEKYQQVFPEGGYADRREVRCGFCVMIAEHQQEDRDAGGECDEVDAVIGKGCRSCGKEGEEDAANKRGCGSADEGCRAVGSHCCSFVVAELFGDNCTDDGAEDGGCHAVEEADRDEQQGVGGGEIEQGGDEEDCA